MNAKALLASTVRWEPWPQRFPAPAQNHPELTWRTLATEHFRVLYHDGLEHTARQAAEVAEAAYGPVTRLYGYRPSGPVRVILKDYDDYGNGAAFFYHDAIEIWITPLEHDFELRGTSDWLRNVLTHELVHIISLGAARKGPQRVPAAFLEYFAYKPESERDDILTGAPDRLALVPLANTVLPMWFAEGVAQYQTEAGPARPLGQPPGHGPAHGRPRRRPALPRRHGGLRQAAASGTSTSTTTGTAW